jgi:uncharacterized protein YbjT (DUF2867 family)
MILVTGASGKTGQAVLAALARSGAPTRAWVRRPLQAEVVTRLGAGEVFVGDLRQSADVHGALENIRSVYHICPNIHPDEIEIGRTVIGAATELGVEHFVLHSVLHPQTEEMPHHWSKLRVEEALLRSGMDFTVLQPAPYMQNLIAGWSLISQAGILRNPYSVGTRLSLVDLHDVAQAAARVLTEPGHTGSTYELAGTPPLDQTEVAALLSSALGRPVRAEAEPVETWAERVRSAGLGEFQLAALTKMFQFYERYGLQGNPGILRWLLGRHPTSLGQFALRTAIEEVPGSSAHPVAP